MLSVRADARATADELTAVRAALTVETLLDGDGVQSLERLRGRFDALGDRLDSPLLAPLRIVPVLGRQVSAAAAQADGAAHGLTVAVEVGTELRELVDGSMQSGPGRVDALRAVARASDAARVEMEALDAGPDEALVSQLRDSRAELEEVRREAIDVLGRAASVGDGLAAFFDGPTDYLLLAANNAQMQNGQGMFLSAGLLHVEDGRMTLDSMSPSADIARPGTPVGLDPDVQARWGWLDPNDDFRHLGLSHRFPEAARTAAALWEAAGHPPVDGVMVVDPFVLEAVVEATGPIDTAEGELAADQIVRYALHDQYRGYFVNGEDASFSEQRRDQLEQLAEEALGRLEDVQELEPAFAERLGAAARGRHLLAWSADAGAQLAWEAAGIDGVISPESLLLSLVNRSGNKLDWFVRSSADLVVEPDADGLAVTVRISVSNEASPVGEPAYVVGPYPGSGLAPAEYLALVTLNLPETAADIRFDGVDQLAVAGADGHNRTVATWVRVAGGTSTELVARFRLPAGTPFMVVEPSGRYSATQWRFGAQVWTDAEARTVEVTPGG